MRFRSIALLSTVAIVAGCGGSSPSPSPASVVKSYLNATADGNYNMACSMLDKSVRDGLLNAGGGATCEQAYTVLAVGWTGVLPTAVAPELQQLRFANAQVSVDGSKAYVKLSGGAVANAIGQLTLSKEGSDWKITSYSNS